MDFLVENWDVCKTVQLQRTADVFSTNRLQLSRKPGVSQQTPSLNSNKSLIFYSHLKNDLHIYSLLNKKCKGTCDIHILSHK